MRGGDVAEMLLVCLPVHVRVCLCLCMEGVRGGCSGTCLSSSLPWVPLQWQSRGISGSWEPNFSLYPPLGDGGV